MTEFSLQTPSHEGSRHDRLKDAVSTVNRIIMGKEQQVKLAFSWIFIPANRLSFMVWRNLIFRRILRKFQRFNPVFSNWPKQSSKFRSIKSLRMSGRRLRASINSSIHPKSPNLCTILSKPRRRPAIFCATSMKKSIPCSPRSIKP